LIPAPPGSSAFHIASESDCLELVKILDDHGGNPNLMRKNGHTPFPVAVLSRDLAVVREMVARGADLTARYNPTDHFADPVKPIFLTRRNQSIMHIAARDCAPEMIEYLYSQGARLDLKHSMSETPLDVADRQERLREARAREGAEDHPERVIGRETAATATIKKLLGQSAGHEASSND
jgi:ankyrin repeat protein